jgi:membrane protease YdiL (CAAX protease family)
MAPMRPVHRVELGSNWRGDEAVARRFPGQRWGIPAAVAILALNLVGFGVAYLFIRRLESPLILLGLVMPSLLAAGAAVVVSVVRGNGPVIDFGLPRRAAELMSQVRVGLVYGAAALIGGLVLAAILVAFSGEVAEPPVLGAAGLSTPWRLVLVAWIAFGAPLCEEIIFRGMVWGALERQRALARPEQRLRRVIGSNIFICAFTAVLFALWHGELWRIAILLYAGTVLGLARMRTGSVLSSAVAHSVNNSLPALIIFMLPTLGG